MDNFFLEYNGRTLTVRVTRYDAETSFAEVVEEPGCLTYGTTKEEITTELLEQLGERNGIPSPALVEWCASQGLDAVEWLRRPPDPDWEFDY